MFKLISLAMHFSAFNQRAIDPMVVEMLNRELSSSSRKTEEKVELPPADESDQDRLAA
jgi:hypothetical protein